MPGVQLPAMANIAPQPKSSAQSSDPSLYLIVGRFSTEPRMVPLTGIYMQSSDDVIYEQDILRDPGSIKPWLIYIDYKHQHGTLLEQAFVRWAITFNQVHPAD